MNRDALVSAGADGFMAYRLGAVHRADHIALVRLSAITKVVVLFNPQDILRKMDIWAHLAIAPRDLRGRHEGYG